MNHSRMEILEGKVQKYNIKNNLGEPNSKLKMPEGRVSELEGKNHRSDTIWRIERKQIEKKKMIKVAVICWNRRERGERIKHKKIFEEIIVENSSNLGIFSNLQIHEAKWIQRRKNTKKSTPGFIIVNLSKIKIKKKIESCKREIPYKGKTI